MMGPNFPSCVTDASAPSHPPPKGWVHGRGELAIPVSEPDRLADEDDVDATGQFLVDLENLSDRAVLPIRGNRPRVLEFQAVLDDPLVRCAQRRDEFLRAD